MSTLVYRWFVAATAVMCLAGGAPAATNLITDGDFQDTNAWGYGGSFIVGSETDNVWYNDGAWQLTANAGPAGAGDYAPVMGDIWWDLAIAQAIAWPSASKLDISFDYKRPSADTDPGAWFAVQIFGADSGQYFGLDGGGARNGTLLWQTLLPYAEAFVNFKQTGIDLGTTTHERLVLLVTAGGNEVSSQANTIDNIVLTEAAALHPGDANGDNRVSVGDLGILAANYGITSGATWAMGDFNGDGKVSVGDLGILAANYGWVGTIPEPMTLSLLSLGVLGLLGRRH